MDSRSSLFGLAAMAAIVAAITASFSRTRTTSVMEAVPPAMAPDTADGLSYTIGAQLLAESCVGVDSAGVAMCVHNPVQVQVFVMTVPDPRDAMLDWMYDQALEATRRAFEKSDYLFDRYWEARTGDSIPRDGGLRRLPANRVLPSVLLLRGRRQASARALIYLIPETPTTGVAERAFRNALAERSRLLAQSGRHGVTVVEDTLRVIGPTFSGSTVSLKALLRGHHAGRGAATAADSGKGGVRVVTGTATSNDNATELGQVARFSATVHDDDTVLDEAARVLQALDIPPKRVAILRETSTAYGLDASETDNTRVVPDAADALRERWMVVPFPLNIASVRNEYARNPDPAPAGAPGVAPVRRTRLGLESSLRTSTTVAPVSGLTAPAQDRMIDEIVQMLRRERVQAVGIVATDIRDKVFLASVLRRRLRDVLLFTTEANNLLLRDERGRALRGMLVFGTYPLHIEHQRWLHEVNGDTSAAGERLAFAAEWQIGLYNATLLQLGRLEEDGLAYETVTSPRRPWPPVWVSVVGANGFMPIRTQLVDDPEGYAYPPDRPRPATENAQATVAHAGSTQGHALNLLNAMSWLAALLFAMLAYVFYAEPATAGASGRSGAVGGARGTGVLLWRNTGAAMLGSLAGISGAIRAQLRGEVSPLARARGRVIERSIELPLLELDIHTWGVARLLLFASIFAPAIVLAMQANALRPDARLAALGAVLLVIIIAGVGFRRMIRCHAREAEALQRAREYPAERFVRQLLVLAGFVYGFFTIRFLLALDAFRSTCIVGRCDAQLEHYFHRVMAIDSGVSPLVPVALAMAVLFCWTGWHLGRTRALRDQTTFEAAMRDTRTAVRQADERTTPGTIAHLAVALAQARWSLFSLAPRPAYGALSVLLAALALWLVWQFDRSLENLMLPPAGQGIAAFEGLLRLPPGWRAFSAFDWLFRASVLAAFGSIMWGIVRMHQNWNALRSVFERMAETPLLKAMAAVRAELAGVGVPSLFLSFAQDAGFYNEEHPFWNSRVEAVAARRWVALQDELSEVPPNERERLHFSAEDREAIAAADRDWGRLPCATRERFLAAMAAALDKHWHGATNGADKARAWLDHSAEFLAVQAAAYCEWGQQILRRLALFLLLALLLTTMMLGSYPFQPQHLFKLMLVGLVALTVVTLFIVTVEMNRDEVLSALTNSAAGRVEWNTRFVLNMVVFGAIPILTLLSSELPLLRTVLVGWIQPFVQSAANF